MYTRFNDNTIETKFVKQLVANTQVPFISTWKPGDFAIRGMIYITRDAIWRCNHTGYPKHIMDTCTPADHATILNFNAQDERNGTENIPYFTKVSPYNFGKEYYNITGSYQSNILGYDATTHFYLGLYLRMMRDIFDLDLMPFYNCFCGEYVSDIDFNSNSEVIFHNNSDYKIASVPVKFGKQYMISINSEVPVETMLVVYGPKGVVKNLTNNLNDIGVTNNSTTYHEGTYRRFNRTSFQHPILYRTKDWHQLYNVYVKHNGRLLCNHDDTEVGTALTNYDQALGQFEKYLRLLIKVPIVNKSSIVVLEGDYTLDKVYESINTDVVTWTNMSSCDATINSKTVSGDWVRPRTVVNYETTYTYTYRNSDVENATHPVEVKQVDGKSRQETLDEVKTRLGVNNITEVKERPDDSSILLSPLGLLLLSDGNSYAFSNRLIEYLLQNVINPLEEFGENIGRILLYAKSQENALKNNTTKYFYPTTHGVWDDTLRKYLFELVLNSRYLTTKVDITGFVDKDTERVITRGQDV